MGLSSNRSALGGGIVAGNDPMMDELRRKWGVGGVGMNAAPSGGGGLFGGGKLSGKDFLGLALGAIGDTLAQRNGGEAVAMPMVFQGLIDARRAKREAEGAQAKRQQDREDFTWELDERAKREGPKREVVEDNAGNRWVRQPNGEYKIDFIDPTEKVYNQGAAVVNVPNPFAGRNPQDIPPIGSRVPAGDIFGAQPASPDTSFTPDANNMRRLYHQQFGPQRGETMFREWLRNSRMGGR